MAIERKEVKKSGAYSPAGLAIHHARYLVAKPFVKGKRVLDIACGEGLGASQMAHLWGAEHVTAIDNSTEAINSAKHNNRDIKNIEFMCEDAYEYLENCDAKFDLIVSIETIEHVNDPERLLKLLVDKRAQGGKVVITCPNDAFYYGPGKSLNHHHQTVFSFEQFKDMCEKHLGEATWMIGTKLAGFAALPMPLWEKPANFEENELEPGFEGQLCDVVPVGGPNAHLLRPEGGVFFAGIFADEKIEPSPTIGLISASSSFDQNIPGKYQMVQGKTAGKASAICFITENQSSMETLSQNLELLPTSRFEYFSCNMENASVDALVKINSNRFSQIHFQSIKAFRSCLEFLKPENSDIKQKAMIWKLFNSNAGQVWTISLNETDYQQLSPLDQSLFNLVIVRKDTKDDSREQRAFCETDLELFFPHNKKLEIENELEIMRVLILAQKRGGHSLHALRSQVLKNFTL